jgi:hypothetical protein
MHSRHRASDRSLALAPGNRNIPGDTVPRYLLRDRDASYGSHFCRGVEAMGIMEVITGHDHPGTTLTSSG